MKQYTIPVLMFAIGFSLTSALTTTVRGQGQPNSAAKPLSSDDLIKNALSAAPAGIAKGAAVMAPGATAAAPMIELRKGSNGWTCLPDDPSTPANDPMCMDKNAMAWAEAWMSKKTPQIPGVGLGYMLQGGSTADNDDPFAKQPKAGGQWIIEPPHLMLFGTKIDPTAYSSTPDTTQPWIMWKGTPYEHLMVPVQ